MTSKKSSVTVQRTTTMTTTPPFSQRLKTKQIAKQQVTCGFFHLSKTLVFTWDSAIAPSLWSDAQCFLHVFTGVLLG
eukprot:645401-Amphidinium_carterae.1